MDSPYHRHVARFARPIAPRAPFRVGGARAGSVQPAILLALRRLGLADHQAGGLDCPDPAALPALGRAAAEAGLCPWRNEAFAVHADPDGAVLGAIDRGALPLFGLAAEGVHVNGLVHRPDGPHLWVARRARTKRLDPGKLDHIVAGGVPAGLTPAQTLVKEAAEEAAMPPALAAAARLVGVIAYAVERPEGLRRDRLRCYDLNLPEDFIPHPNDGEAEEFMLWPLARVAATVRDTDDFKFNVNLVLTDLLIRRGEIAGAEAESLSRALAALSDVV